MFTTSHILQERHGPTTDMNGVPSVPTAAIRPLMKADAVEILMYHLVTRLAIYTPVNEVFRTDSSIDHFTSFFLFLQCVVRAYLPTRLCIPPRHRR